MKTTLNQSQLNALIEKASQMHEPIYFVDIIMDGLSFEAFRKFNEFFEHANSIVNKYQNPILISIIFINCEIKNMDLSNLYFNSLSVNNVLFKNVNFSDSVISLGSFTNATFDGCKFCKTFFYMTSIRHSVIADSLLEHLKTEMFKIIYSAIHHTTLNHIVTMHVDFSCTILTMCSFSQSIFQYSYLTNACFQNCSLGKDSFLDSDLNAASFYKTTYEGVNKESTDDPNALIQDTTSIGYQG
jgi:uncharacterized protein YjbI with pentapeptide repeats